MILKLTRVASSSKGTFGVITIDDVPFCVTCEDPWNNNERMISCIPPGVYPCAKFNGTKFKDVWEVKNVPGRSAILFHAGNTINDTHGCILVGRCFGASAGLPAVMQSQEVMTMLRDKLPDEFELVVR